VKRLSDADAQFLLDVLDLTEALRKTVNELRMGRTQLSEDDAEKLRDLCGERLQTHGFGEGYEPTTEGRRLEELIDRLFVG
jgi:hypothetical protein